MNWERKKLKQNAKTTMKRNYINIIIVCFIIALVAAGYTSSSINLRFDDDNVNAFHLPTMSETIENTVRNALSSRSNENSEIDKGLKEAEKTLNGQLEKIEDKFNLRNATEGTLATLINNSNGSKSFFMGILNTVNKFVFDGKILEGTIAAISTVGLFLFWLFVQNILLVGECRFFLETKTYTQSNVSSLLFIYRSKKMLHVAGIMFARFFFNLLWYFTIVGGFIKSYSYLMIPYIVAENPEISRKDAFALSKQMMLGNKWNAFKLDLSFVLWHILSLITFGFARFLYVNPLISATRSELYFELREYALKENFPLASSLKDKYLLNPPIGREDGKYPLDLLLGGDHTKRFDFDYAKNYSITSLIFIFFVICFIGWLWEVFLFIFKLGVIINRGTLVGPWLPIYGTGSILILLILKPFRGRPLLFFPSAFVLCGLLEYFSSYILEKLFHQYWWDYSNMFFNINGRVCLEGLIFFAAGCGLVVYVLAPAIDELVGKIPKKTKSIILVVLITLFISDIVYSSSHPNSSEGYIDSSGEMIKNETYIAER